MNQETPILEVDRISKNFGGLPAVHNLSFTVMPAQLKGLIGPNGAGKTTCINLITGALSLTSGEVRFEGKRITGLPLHKTARLSISRTFQLLRIFQEMTVLENVMAGCHRWANLGTLQAAIRLPGARAKEREIMEVARSEIDFIGLTSRAHALAGALPVGEQRLLEIARALAGKPRLLLLDEPAAGLNDAERARLGALLRELTGRGLSILLIEHNMDLVMSISDEIVVLNYGEKLAEGRASEVRNLQTVISAYLGDASDA
ncbi:MAG TPA: ABC transporter ATP-binding protein [Thermodesulfobacteriota bacterium]|nr:ABC transporter ATP-binding protein [Thermodesulfobacteriota bacterium]